MQNRSSSNVPSYRKERTAFAEILAAHICAYTKKLVTRVCNIPYGYPATPLLGQFCVSSIQNGTSL